MQAGRDFGLSGKKPMRFVADVMLGKLAKWLRVLGFDTRYQSFESARESQGRNGETTQSLGFSPNPFLDLGKKS
jgi:hypothetical protein